MTASCSAERIICLQWIVILATLCMLSGCVIPYPSHRIYEGTEQSSSTLQWLQPGKTTRMEVLEKLGAPDIEFVDRNTIAYNWTRQSGGALWIAYQAAFVDPIWLRRSLLIQFDATNTVAVYSIISRPTEIIPYDARAVSLDAPYDDWRNRIDQWQLRHGIQPATQNKGE